MKPRHAALLLAVLLAACSTPSPKPAVPPSGPAIAAVSANAVRLTRAAFSDLPDWKTARFDAALAAFRRGCAPLKKKDPAAAMGGAGYAGKVGDWLPLCDAASNAIGGDVRAFLESRFTPYAISDGDKPEGLFTGYYEPEILAAPTRGGIYQTPVYGLPDDWVRFDLGEFDAALAGQHAIAQVRDHTLQQYPERAAINAAPPKGPVLLWAADPVTVFFLQIQGSGRARFPDGSSVRLAYAGANGQPYTAIGRTLIAEGQLTRENVSLQSIRAWLLAHPDDARRVMETDKSYVFFLRTGIDDPALGSTGTLGVNLTPLASLAVDAKRNALGALYFVAADGPDPVHALVTAQDTGGAIKGAVRGDIFFGFGDKAEERAGHMNAPGRLFVLLPNTIAARIGAGGGY